MTQYYLCPIQNHTIPLVHAYNNANNLELLAQHSMQHPWILINDGTMFQRWTSHLDLVPISWHDKLLVPVILVVMMSTQPIIIIIDALPALYATGSKKSLIRSLIGSTSMLLNVMHFVSGNLIYWLLLKLHWYDPWWIPIPSNHKGLVNLWLMLEFGLTHASPNS